MAPMELEWWRRRLPLLLPLPPLLLLLRQWRNNQKAVGATSIHDVPDDLLRLILLCLDSPIWLIRAACACKRWRRVVNGPDEGRAFLRLANSLHPTVVGQYHNTLSNGFFGDIRFVPSSPIDVGNRFSVDFLDKKSYWFVLDCHGGLVLLCKFACTPTYRQYWSCLVVYDPLTGQKRQIRSPPPPYHKLYNYGDNLLLHGDDGNISISNFRVLHQLNVDASNPKAYVFSTANGGEWGWRFLSRSSTDEDILSYCHGYMVAGRAADGSLYVVLMKTRGFGRRIITVDNTSLVLSRVNLPATTQVLDTACFKNSTFTIVYGPGVLIGPCSSPTTSIVHVRGEELELFRHVHGREEWVLEHSIHNLLEATRGLSISLDKEQHGYVVWRTMVGHIADGGASFAILSAYTTIRWWNFSFDVNTMELRLLPQELYPAGTYKTFNYTLPWPQFLRTCP